MKVSSLSIFRPSAAGSGNLPSAPRPHPRSTVCRVIVLIAVLSFAGCARKPTLVITVGGMGFSQMGSIRRAIQRQCPNADVVSAGAWDAYKSDVLRMIRKSRRDHLVLVGHSLGCQTAAQTASQVSKVDLVVLIEPAWDDIRLPRNVGRCLWFRRSDFGMVRQAKVIGASPTQIKGGHDDIPHSAELIAEVVKAINEIPEDPAATRGKAGWRKVGSR